MAEEPEADALLFTPSVWLKYGEVAEPSTREKMIMLAIQDIQSVGPADFNAMRVCDRLGIKHPMVNYHFGNRDGLLAEATWWAYQEWTRSVRDSIQQAPANAEKRLRAFVQGEVEWAQRMGGMYLLLQYPLSSAGAQQIVSDKYQAQMEKIFEYHLALLTVIIGDLRSGKVSSVDFDEETQPTASLLLRPNHVITAGHLAWMTHGLASWSTGHHISTKGFNTRGVKDLSVAIGKKTYIDTIVTVAKGK
jgi:AcrR family transcriptional regulator